MYQQRLKGYELRDICCTLANGAEEDEMLIDQKTGKVIGLVVGNKYHKEKFSKTLWLLV